MRLINAWIYRLVGISMILGAVVWLFRGDIPRDPVRLQMRGWWGFVAFVLLGLACIRMARIMSSSSERKGSRE